MKLSSRLHAVENPETSCTYKTHSVLCCPLSFSYWSRIRTRPDTRNACTSKRKPPCSCMHHNRERLARTSHTRISPALAFRCVIPLHRIFYELSLFWTASGSLPIVSRTPTFCIIVVVKHSSTISIWDMLLVDPLSTHVASSVWGWGRRSADVLNGGKWTDNEWAALDSRQLVVLKLWGWAWCWQLLTVKSQ